MAKKTANENSVETAERTLRDLQAKAGQLAEAGKANDAEMAAIAFASHTGDAKAAAKLETLTDRALRRERELKSIATAISVAQQNLAEAEQAEARTHGCKVARELLKRADAIVSLARSMDDANVLRVKASRAIEDELTEMRSIAQAAGL